MLDLTCFGDNYIGIRGECDATTPDSGIYVNDLPGVTLELASSLATAENVKGVTLLRQYEHEAIRKVWRDIKTKLSNQITIDNIIDQRQVGVHENEIDQIKYLATVAADVGIKIQKTDCDPYTAIRVNYIDIRANTTLSGKTLTITDGLTPGCDTKTFTFDITPCKKVRIYTAFTAFSGNVFVTVDGSDIDLEDMSIYSNGCACRNSCSCSTYGCFTVDGWNGTSEVTQSYGMTANVSCVCSGSEFLCAVKDEIAEAVQMRMGILIAQDLLTSKRCNFMVKNSAEDAKNMLIMWLGGTDVSMGVEIKSEYWRLIGQTASAIKNSFKVQNSKCISCGRIKAVETLP